MLDWFTTGWGQLRPAQLQRRYFSLLLPLLLLLFPRTEELEASDVGRLLEPMPMQVRARQARRVRVLLQESIPVRVDGSSWGVPLVVRFDTGQVELRSVETGERLAVDSGHRIEPDTGRFLRLNSAPFRGVIEAFYNPVGAGVVVNELPMEDYLKGVVPLELGPVQFPYLEAQKVQSIAARTYSLRHLGNFAHQGFDLYSDVRSQVYAGVSAEKELSNLAVLETRGQVATADREPIFAYYSSTCGGETAPASEAFGDHQEIAYLQGGISCPDQSSPYRNWEAKISRTDFLNRLGLAGPDLKGVKARRFSAGRLREVRVQTPTETRTIAAQDLRRSLGLRSTWITHLELLDDGIHFEGHGFGHGVGLCQFGSVEMARRGRRAEEILKHYYPGISLQKIY